jgi:hypothetical protein
MRKAYSVVYRYAYKHVQQRSFEGSGVVGAMRLGLRCVWSGVGVLIGLFRCLAARGGVWGLRTPLTTCRSQSQTDTTLNKREGGLGKIGIEEFLMLFFLLGTCVSFAFVLFLGTCVSSAFFVHYVLSYLSARYGQHFVEGNVALHPGRGATMMRAYSVVHRYAYSTPLITICRRQSQTDTTHKHREGGLGRIGIDGIFSCISCSFLGTRVSFASFSGTCVSLAFIYSVPVPRCERCREHASVHWCIAWQGCCGRRVCKFCYFLSRQTCRDCG